MTKNYFSGIEKFKNPTKLSRKNGVNKNTLNLLTLLESMASSGN